MDLRFVGNCRLVDALWTLGLLGTVDWSIPYGS